MSLLLVRDLRVTYGHVLAVDGISFTVERGEIVTLIGPNGAGKSSALNAIAGLVRPAAGSVQLDGAELAGLPAHRVLAAGVAVVPEGRAILQRMSVRENLLVACDARGTDRAQIDAQLARFPSLQRRLEQPAGALSGGEQQMLAIARALLLQPRILLLDEPSMGLAPLLVRQIFDTISALRKEGTTILLVEQNAKLALGISQRACVLERGRVQLSGDAAELSRDPRVQAAYLGGGV